MNVNIRREGKERNQGVAFMGDGTMIVVDNARKHIGKNVNVAVTSVLQTSAGRMIFASLIEKEEHKKKQPQQREQQQREQKSQGHKGQGQDQPGDISG
jgi:hypothetical protein